MKVSEALERARIIRDTLGDSDPDLDAIIDTECDMSDLLDWAIKKDAELLGFQQMNKDLAALYTKRGQSMGKASSNIRGLVHTMMDSSGRTKHKCAFGTASIGVKKKSVIITDEKKVPIEYFKITKAPMKSDIMAALNNGELVEGAELSNGGVTLTIRR